MSTTVVGIYEAKTSLSRLVERVTNGHEVVITKSGVPVAKIVAYQEPPKRKPGSLKGKLWISPDFDDPLPEFGKLWDGE